MPLSLFTDLFSADFFAATLRFSIPILLAALGEAYSERAGIFNVQLEGMMLMGAFGAFLGTYFTGNVWIGLTWGMTAGCLLGLLHAIFCVSLKANQIVSGIALNILALGITGFTRRAVLGSRTGVEVAAIPPLPIPLLDQIPFVGVFFQQSILGYAAFILIPVAAFILFRTTWGLRIRAVGENPAAADTAGISVNSTRYFAVMLCGVLAGLGGSFLSLVQVHQFVDGMTAGRGFISMAAVIFGNWHPVGALWGSLLFGAGDALQLRMQALAVPIPYQVLSTLPYALTLIAVTGFVRRARPPAALGLPYSREER